MKFENKHPAEIEFRRMMDEVNTFLNKYEAIYLDGDEKEALKNLTYLVLLFMIGKKLLIKKEKSDS